MMHDEHLNIRGLKAAGKCVDCRVPDLHMRVNNKTWIKLGFTYGVLTCVKKTWMGWDIFTLCLGQLGVQAHHGSGTPERCF